MAPEGGLLDDTLSSVFFFLKILLFIFRQRGREGERKGEKYRSVAASCATPNGDLAHNTGMCPNWELNQQPLGSQTGAQSTEPHQPRPDYKYFNKQI